MPPSKSSRTSTAAAAPTAAPNAGGGAPAAAGARQGVHAAPAAAAAPEPAAAAPKAPRKPLKINDLVTIPVALFGQEWCELNYPAATHGAGWWKRPGSRLGLFAGWKVIQLGTALALQVCHPAAL